MRIRGIVLPFGASSRLTCCLAHKHRRSCPVRYPNLFSRRCAVQSTAHLFRLFLSRLPRHTPDVHLRTEPSQAALRTGSVSCQALARARYHHCRWCPDARVLVAVLARTAGPSARFRRIAPLAAHRSPRRPRRQRTSSCAHSGRHPRTSCVMRLLQPMRLRPARRHPSSACVAVSLGLVARMFGTHESDVSWHNLFFPDCMWQQAKPLQPSARHTHVPVHTLRQLLARSTAAVALLNRDTESSSATTRLVSRTHQS